MDQKVNKKVLYIDYASWSPTFFKVLAPSSTLTNLLSAKVKHLRISWRGL